MVNIWGALPWRSGAELGCDTAAEIQSRLNVTHMGSGAVCYGHIVDSTYIENSFE